MRAGGECQARDENGDKFYGCEGKAFAVHHIVPRHRGGTDHPDNLMAVCESCHARFSAVETTERARDRREVEEEQKRATHPGIKKEGYQRGNAVAEYRRKEQERREAAQVKPDNATPEKASPSPAPPPARKVVARPKRRDRSRTALTEAQRIASQRYCAARTSDGDRYDDCLGMAVGVFDDQPLCETCYERESL
ncbi:HNH endonuclease family protein [Mycobacteroides abscessus MAB_030201_1075]|uniref:HNH endonuclease family protein n=1 Tax=Mycobacteroides abscessus MAB_030201_1075 TaxID=1335410 RepID=A0A829PJB7_9MYCO|nr:HNH endonuclease family protein [Mycobacteroides abscessus MAB_030201_1075]